MRLTKTIMLVLASVLCATLVLGGPARAQEESPRAQVEQLLPRLQSEDDAVRALAEKELFRMGEPARREMERLSRDTDTRRALTALRLLQSDRWSAGTLRDGEESLRRSREKDATDLAEIERAMEERFRALQKRLDDALRDMPRFRAPDWRVPDFEMPEIEVPGWAKPGADDDGATSTVTTQGSVTRGDRVLTWSLAADGKVRVTARDGDGAEKAMQADDLDAFRAAHPDVAAELDEAVPTWTGAPTVRLWTGAPELRVPSRVWRWWNDDDAAPGPTTPGSGTESHTPALGILWAPVSPVLRHHLRLEDRGVLVESVLADTLAARLRMQPMDVLIELDGKPIRRREDIGAALSDAGDRRVEAVVIRRGERLTLRQPE